jgi:predicted DNA repair protein MutK
MRKSFAPQHDEDEHALMASSLLTLLDDIATLLDDVAILTKVAAKKTAGVLGDDLALNAQQVSGVHTNRELPVVWAVAKGSFVNKLILVPAAMLISWLAPWAVTPLMMIGGAFLCYEGVEKLLHKFLHRREEAVEHVERLRAVADESVDMVAFERDKIKGAIRTDFILSAEIIVISLGSVPADATFMTRFGVLAAIAIIMTVGVYGLVAGIVKLDDGGLHLSRRPGDGGLARLQRAFGRGIIAGAPYLMKFLSIAGTAAMFLVGGSILAHGVPAVAHAIEGLVPDGIVGTLLTMLAEAVVGILVGIVVVAVVLLIQRMRGKKPVAH